MGYDGSGMLEDDYLSRQEISIEKYFDIKDTLSEKETALCRTEWEAYRSKDFSCSQKRRVKAYYVFYMIFGYKVGDCMLKFAGYGYRCVLKIRTIARTIKRTLRGS